MVLLFVYVCIGSFLHYCILEEDKKLIKVVLVKSDRSAASCWKSLLEGQYNSDAFTFNEMEKKLTLERFQNEVRCTSGQKKCRTTLRLICVLWMHGVVWWLSARGHNAIMAPPPPPPPPTNKGVDLGFCSEGW